MNNIVCKFGGTSLAGPQNIKNVKDIVVSGNKRFVVVSAPGKRDKQDTKLTDALIDSFNKSKNGEDFLQSFEFFKERFEHIKKELNLEIDFSHEYQGLLDAINEHESYDYVVSRGEYFSARVIAKFLGYEFLDAASFITFSDDGKIDLSLTRTKFLGLVDSDKCYVVPGFYGTYQGGEIKTFTRGGSDVTGAILATVAGANVYENWTDVDGFLVADPRVCKNPSLIKELSYQELRELSYMGASVLHQDCVKFLRENDVVLNLRNSFNPSCNGSLILPDSTEIEYQKLTGIAGKKGFTIIHIEKFAINESLGIIEKIANILKKYNVSVEHIPTSIDSISVIVKSCFVDPAKLEAITDEIAFEIQPDNLKIIDNIALVSVVGGILRKDKDVERQVFKSILDTCADIITLNKGAGGISIIFGVYEKDYDVVVQSLYESLFI